MFCLRFIQRAPFAILLVGIFVFSFSPRSYGAVNISGFVNAEYNQFNIGGKSANPDFDPPFGGFDIQRVGLDFQADSDIFTAIAQLQIEHGAEIEDVGNGIGANSSSPVTFGELSLERAYIKARFSRYFRVEVGKDQTPTLWERAHYPSIYPSITQPQIEENVFEEYIVGAVAEGSWENGLLYNFWLSKSEPTLASNSTIPGGQLLAVDNKTLASSEGGRVGWQRETKNSSLYFGYLFTFYHDYPTQFVSGAESAIRWFQTTIWFEYTHGLLTKGWYILPQYEIALKNKMFLSPYLLIDSFNDVSVGPQARMVYAAGLNFKPKSFLTVKAEGVLTPANNGIEQRNEALRFGVIYYFD